MIKRLFAILVVCGGGIASALTAAIIGVSYQMLAGTHPDVLGFEDIYELSPGQELFQKILMVSVFALGLYVTYRTVRKIL